MKRIGLIFLIWISIIIIGSVFTFYFFLFLILGPITLFMSYEMQHESLLFFIKFSALYSLPALIIFSYYSLYKSKNIVDMIDEAPQRIIALIFLTFVVLTIYFYPFLTIFWGFLPFMFATIFVFAIAKNIIRRIK
jgi:cobalamin synthase